MSDEHDEYLWARQGPVSLEVAGLERELRPLAWTPRELPLPATTAATIAVQASAPEPPVAARVSERDRGRNWAPVIAGLAAAAAVLAVLMWTRGAAERSAPDPATTQPSLQPAGQPSPNLRDPFADDDVEPPGAPPPSKVAPSLVDPFGNDPGHAPRRQVSPDLKDPFANSASAPAQPPAPTKPRTPSPDLVDPFKGDETKQAREPGKLYDPFTGKPSKPPSPVSPDLKDPFER